ESARSRKTEVSSGDALRPSTSSTTSTSADSIDARLREALAAHGIRAVMPPPPQDNNLVVLGRTLFFDVRLSGNKNTSCSSCHYHRSATSDARSLAVGEGAQGVGKERALGRGKLLARRAPMLYDRGLEDALFWDGRVARGAHGVTAPVAI